MLSKSCIQCQMLEDFLLVTYKPSVEPFTQRAVRSSEWGDAMMMGSRCPLPPTACPHVIAPQG
jgi:hypothetical protein